MTQLQFYLNQANEEIEAATLLLEKNYRRACISRLYIPLLLWCLLCSPSPFNLQKYQYSYS
jgi:hypothetical protein